MGGERGGVNEQEGRIYLFVENASTRKEMYIYRDLSENNCSNFSVLWVVFAVICVKKVNTD